MTKQIGFDGAEDGDFVDIDGEAEDISELQNDIDSQMNRIFEEFGGDPNDTEFNIHVKRVMAGRGELEHCFSCLPHELPIVDRIKNEFGAGEYSIWIYKNKKIWKRRKMNIAKAIARPLPQDNGLGNGGIKDFLAAMQANQERQWSQMQELIARQNQQPNQLEQMQSMLSMMAMMKQVMGESKPVDPMGQFTKTIELAKTLAEDFGGGSEKSSLDRLIETALPALLEGAKSETPQTPQNFIPQTLQQVSKPVTLQVPITPDIRKQNPIKQPTQGDNPEMFTKGLIKSKLPQLLNLAKNEKDAGLYAEVILDQIPAPFLNAYCEFVTKDNAISELVLINPEINNYLPWFNEFRTVTLELIQEETEGETEGENLTNSDSMPQTSDHVSESDTKPPIEGETENTGDISQESNNIDS